MPRVLIACTSATKLTTGAPTGCWVEEARALLPLPTRTAIPTGLPRVLHLTRTRASSQHTQVASPYLLWREKGFAVDIASISGGPVPWDSASTSGDFFTPEAAAFMQDGEVVALQVRMRHSPVQPALSPRRAETASRLVSETPSVADVLKNGVGDYDALFLPGCAERLPQHPLAGQSC